MFLPRLWLKEKDVQMFVTLKGDKTPETTQMVSFLVLALFITGQHCCFLHANCLISKGSDTAVIINS